eukprot:GHVS01028367.1.p1 GENE.GHVS01028367.1~~GHVS01028367.1.p1  ORF type:complete len:251 (-),score=34.41 GHVS01028367.1:811-1563(-)
MVPVDTAEEKAATQTVCCRDKTISDDHSKCIQAQSSVPASFVIVNNISKGANAGSIVRSAVAFGTKEIVVVGERKLKTFGNQGTNRHCTFRHMGSLSEAATYLHGRGVRICGIELTPNAVPCHYHPFVGDTAFMLGNEGTGMNQKQLDMCDQFVYVPQYSGGTASLNVGVAASIVLHHFAVWAGLPEQSRDSCGFKFAVDQLPTSVEMFRNPTAEQLQDRRNLQMMREEGRKRNLEVDAEVCATLFTDKK